MASEYQGIEPGTLGCDARTLTTVPLPHSSKDDNVPSVSTLYRDVRKQRGHK